MKFKLITKEDIPALQEIAEGTWEGNDYLKHVIEPWIKDGGFWGCYKEEKLLACSKLTILPDGVAWLEGLRVHPDYYRLGIGKSITTYVLEKALQLRSEGIVNRIEFCTYYLNQGSLNMSYQAGFEVIEQFYNMSARKEDYTDIKNSEKIQEISMPIEELLNSGDYLSAGWRIVRSKKESLSWLEQNTAFYKVGQTRFYKAGHGSLYVILENQIENPLKLVRAMFSLTEDEEIEIVFQKAKKEFVSQLKRIGCSFWDEEEVTNMYLLRYMKE